MLSAKYTVKLTRFDLYLQNKNKWNNIHVWESLIPRYMFHTEKSENALAIFLHGTDFN